MEKLSQMPNIGPEVERQLNEAGIHTPDELRRVGSRVAWLRILARDPSACINRLCGLEGAIQGIRWHNLDDATKDSLRQFLKTAKMGTSESKA